MLKTFCIQCSGKINIAHEISHFTLLMLTFKYFNELLQLLLKVVDIYVILLNKQCTYYHLIKHYHLSDFQNEPLI